MLTLPERAASTLLVLAGLLSLAPLLAGAPGDAAAHLPWLQHSRFMMGLWGAGLVAAAFVPALRTGVVAGAVLSKLGFVVLAARSAGVDGPVNLAWLEAGAVAMLLAASAMYLHAARRQARWDGALP